jgi:hypothetical protein
MIIAGIAITGICVICRPDKTAIMYAVVTNHAPRIATGTNLSRIVFSTAITSFPPLDTTTYGGGDRKFQGTGNVRESAREQALGTTA